MTTKWGTTDRVYYCEVHDSMIRKLTVELSDEPQCDWALASHIPSFVEPCVIAIMKLVADGSG